MSVGTTIDSTIGVLTTNNSSGLSINTPLTMTRQSGSAGFLPFPCAGKAMTASQVLSSSDYGLLTITGSSAVTLKLPLASSAQMGMFVFRTTGNVGVQHVITGALESQGTLSITDGTTKGSKLTLSGAVGAAVTMLCDGVNWQVLGSTSGSATTAYVIAGT